MDAVDVHLDCGEIEECAACVSGSDEYLPVTAF
jgi:hypothetical protein